MYVHLRIEVGGEITRAISGVFSSYDGKYEEMVDKALLERVIPAQARMNGDAIQRELNKTIGGLSGLYTRLSIKIGGVLVLEDYDVRP